MRTAYACETFHGGFTSWQLDSNRLIIVMYYMHLRILSSCWIFYFISSPKEKTPKQFSSKYCSDDRVILTIKIYRPRIYIFTFPHSFFVFTRNAEKRSHKISSGSPFAVLKAFEVSRNVSSKCRKFVCLSWVIYWQQPKSQTSALWPRIIL